MTDSQFMDLQNILAEAFGPLVGLWVVGLLAAGILVAVLLIWLIVLRDRLNT